RFLLGGTGKANTERRCLFRLPQSGRVFGHCANLPVVHVRRDSAHHTVDIVRSLAFPEGGELGGDVLGVLAGETRKLRGNPVAGGTRAARARRNAVHSVTAAPELLAERGEVLVSGR